MDGITHNSINIVMEVIDDALKKDIQKMTINKRILTTILQKCKKI